jgi:Ca-activated chloride channel family protein
MKFAPILPWWVTLVVSAIFLAAILLMFFVLRKRSGWGLPFMRRALIMFSILAILLNPSIPGGLTPASLANLDVIFAIDTTTSMGALDYVNDTMRLEGAKSDATALSQKLLGARFSIITFDQTARVLLPTTSDSTAFTQAIQNLTRERSNSSIGSSISTPLDIIKQQIDRDLKAHPNRPQVVFYMGDGEQTSEDKIAPFDTLKTKLAGGAVLGYGTTSGAKMTYYGGYGPDDLLCGASAYAGADRYDAHGFGSCYIQNYAAKNGSVDYTDLDKAAVSKADPATLKIMAGQMGVEYVDRNSGGAVDALVGAAKIQTAVDNSHEVSNYQSLYFVFAAIAALLLTWELAALTAKRRSS